MRSLFLFTAFALVTACSLASASTVTLTGSCIGTLVNATHNYTTFYLTNSGNGTATQIRLIPELSGATPAASGLNASLIGPGGNLSFEVYMRNFSLPGGYAENFFLEYSQGSNTYVALFPCLIYIERQAQSLVAITSVNNVGGDEWNASAFVLASYPVTATVHVAVPPELVGPPDASVVLEPNTQTPIRFNVTTKQTASASFSAALEVSYVHDSVHYATMHPLIVGIVGSGVGHSSVGQSGLIIAIGAIVAVLLALIALSVVKKRRNRPDAAAAVQTGEGQTDGDRANDGHDIG